jgi:glycosyltransferase involved in cell wall biosynthesis
MNSNSRATCVHILATLSEGGNEVLARSLIQNWPVFQAHIIVVLGRQSGPMQPEFEALGSVSFMPLGWPITWAGLKAIWSWLGSVQPDALISYTFNIQALPLCWLAKIRGVRSVVMRVGNPPPSSASGRRRWRWLIRLCRWARVPLMSCSMAVHEQLSVLSRLPRGSWPILNGCDVEAIAARAKAARSARPPGDLKKVLMVARLDPIKDQETLMRAFVAAQKPDWQLQLVGVGSDRAWLEDLATELRLDPTQVFHGRRSDIPELLGQADLFAFSTTPAEGFGIVLIEAMAAGLPILASDVPACREVLKDGAAGRLVQAGDREAWCAALQQLMASEADRAALSENALDHVNIYDIRRTSQRWLDVLTT